jgi:hypothetical protein
VAEKNGGIASGVVEVAKSFGLGGVVLVGGVVIIALAIFKGADIEDTQTQLIVIIGGFAGGVIMAAVGLFLLRRGARSVVRQDDTHREHDVFIAAPMAGFGGDDAGRKATVDLIHLAAEALRRQRDVNDVYMPALARPDTANYETPATAFDLELAALKNAKKYMLILPPAAAPGSSVLVTAGIAIRENIPCVIFAPDGQALPYLLEGAAQSKHVNVRLHRYRDPKHLVHLIDTDGLRLFGDDAE